jgi:hypothetical protein
MSSPKLVPMSPRTSAALPSLILALGALASSSGASRAMAASKTPPHQALTVSADASSGESATTNASDDSGALLRELIRKGVPRVKQVKDERGRVVRIEFSRRGGTRPDEIITFPAAGVTQRERDDDGDGFFEERRIERRDIEVLVERRTGKDETWRAFEKLTYHRSEGLVRIQTYDASGTRILSTRTEPLWREESYADAYARCLSGASPQEDACSVSPHPLGNRLPDP